MDCTIIAESSYDNFKSTHNTPESRGEDEKHRTIKAVSKDISATESQEKQPRDALKHKLKRLSDNNQLLLREILQAEQ